MWRSNVIAGLWKPQTNWTDASMPILGLAAGPAPFTVGRWTSEIGNRRVSGGGVAHLVRLLIGQFTRPVVIANLIAFAVAGWLMHDWLHQLDARVTWAPGPFSIAGLLAFVIGTAAGHAFRVSRTNPIHAHYDQ